jgi:hypothetical protein
MKIDYLQQMLEKHTDRFPRFVLTDGDYIPVHAHLTEVGHVVKNFVDCGGATGKDEKLVVQTHVGNDTEHRLRADRFAKILSVAGTVLPTADLDVEIEYDCCVVAQYPIAEARAAGKYLDLILKSGRTQCRPRERLENTKAGSGRAGGGCC